MGFVRQSLIKSKALTLWLSKLKFLKIAQDYSWKSFKIENLKF